MTDQATIERLRKLAEHQDALDEARRGDLGRFIPELPEHVRRELEERN